MTDPMDRSSPGYQAAGEQPGSAERRDAELIALLRQTNRLLGEVLAVLRGFSHAAAPGYAAHTQPLRPAERPSAPGIPREQWLQAVNDAFRLPTPESVRAALQARFAGGGDRLMIADFNDWGEYQQDHRYAQYAPGATGCCFLLPVAGNAEAYYAYPYPGGPTWFQLGREALKPLYDMSGDLQSLAPRLQIQKPATLRRTERPNKKGDPIFVPAERGTLVVRSPE